MQCECETMKDMLPLFTPQSKYLFIIMVTHVFHYYSSCERFYILIIIVMHILKVGIVDYNGSFSFK